MGIIKKELTEFELADGTQYFIHLNQDGSIHVHIDNIRYDMAPEEFAHFANVIERAQLNLHRIKYGQRSDSRGDEKTRSGSRRRVTKTAPLRELFKALDEREVTYVVAQGYDSLPEMAVGDIDLYVEDHDFDRAVAICKELGFEERAGFEERVGPILNLVSLFNKVVDNPGLAIDTVLRSPRAIPNLIRHGTGSLVGPTHSNHRNRKLQNDDLELDVRNNLAYVSPMDDSRIQVKPSVTDRFFDRRRRYNGFYVPAPSDELAHILAHCIFDKKGKFSEHHVDRCDELVETVTDDPEQHEQFRNLLSDIFYAADDLVYEMTVEGEYDAILSELYRYTEY